MLSLESCKYLVVGSGLWGSVLAERIASQFNEKVLVIDRRAHSGGNCHSELDEETGIECHVYGSHIFHTSDQRVWEYVRQFCSFNTYRHRVLTEFGGRLYQMPIGLATINSYYHLNLKPYEAEAFIAAEAALEDIESPSNLEEKGLSLIGRPLYEAFIKGYTAKQWNLPLNELPADIITRLPVRTNYNPDYFDDFWQGLPMDGYGALFDKLLSHPNITVQLGVSFADIRGSLPVHCRIFHSGALDDFFDYALGALAWRSLRFEKEILPYADYQGNAVVNQADITVPYTRTHEYRHYHPERPYQRDKTVIVREYPENFARGKEAYYPVNRPEDLRRFEQYRQLAAARAPNITFGGRLGSYAYVDMDKTVSEALETFDKLAADRTKSGA